MVTGPGALPQRCQKCKNAARNERAKRAKNPALALVDKLVQENPTPVTDDREGPVLKAMKHFAETAMSSNPAAEVLFETAISLADDVDTAHSPMQRAAATKELRGVLIEITEYKLPEEGVSDDPFGIKGLSA